MLLIGGKMNRKYSLKKSYEIEKVMSLKKSVGNRFYTIYYQQSEGEMKIAISVSKKVGRAVIRNYEKRAVREIIRKNKKELIGIKALIIIKRLAVELTFQEKDDSLSNLFSKILKEKKSVGNRFYTIYYQQSEGEMKIAISVSKKVGRAVIRNYEKRAVREIIRKNKKELIGIKALIIIKKLAVELTFQEKDDSLSNLFSKILKEKKNEQK